MSDELPERNPNFSVHSRARSFLYAGRGLRFFLVTQHNAWVHLGASLCVLALSAMLGISRDDWRWIALAIALVWIAETLNTAVEQLGDAISLQHNARIGRAKDIAAGAVLISALAATVIGALTLIPYLVGR